MKNLPWVGIFFAITLLFEGASYASACVVRADAKNVGIASEDRHYLVQYPNGSKVERVARYTAIGNFFLQECGEAKGIDTRACSWDINTMIVRQIGTIDPEGDITFKESLTAVFKDNIAKDGGPIKITKGHKETCNDRLGEWEQDGQIARNRARDALPSVIKSDRPRVAEIFSARGGKIIQ